MSHSKDSELKKNLFVLNYGNKLRSTKSGKLLCLKQTLKKKSTDLLKDDGRNKELSKMFLSNKKEPARYDRANENTGSMFSKQDDTAVIQSKKILHIRKKKIFLEKRQNNFMMLVKMIGYNFLKEGKIDESITSAENNQMVTSDKKPSKTILIMTTFV